MVDEVKNQQICGCSPSWDETEITFNKRGRGRGGRRHLLQMEVTHVLKASRTRCRNVMRPPVVLPNWVVGGTHWRVPKSREQEGRRISWQEEPKSWKARKPIPIKKYLFDAETGRSSSSSSSLRIRQSLQTYVVSLATAQAPQSCGRGSWLLRTVLGHWRGLLS